jgi:hypothetical protein
MSAEDATSPPAGRPGQVHAGAEPQHPQRESRAEKTYSIRPVMRGVTLLGGALGTTGASLSGHQIVAIGTLLVTAAIIGAELWIAKRRDDVFSKIAMKPKVDPAVLRALTVHEAVRSGLLSSEDTVRILRPEPDKQQSLRQINRPDRIDDGPLKSRAPSRRSGHALGAWPCFDAFDRGGGLVTD